MLSKLFAPTEARAQATTWGVWQGDSTPTASGVDVNADTAMGVLAFSGCVMMIADAIATLPVDAYRAVGSERVEIARPTWLDRPTVDLDFTDWATQVVVSLLTAGNAYVIVTRSGARIVELLPVAPDMVAVSRENGRKVYRLGGVEYRGEVLHLKAPMRPGADVGMAPLDYARETLGLALAAQKYGAESFDNDLKMPGVIEMQKRAQPDQMRDMANAWRRARNKGSRGLPGVLDDGATWKATGITPEQGQFLQTRQWTAAEIAAQVFFIDPRELGIPLTGSTLEYVNAESRESSFNTKGLLRWVARMESALSSLLPRPQYVKLNLNARLRGNTTERWDQYVKAMDINVKAGQIGMAPVMTTEEMRDLEDWDPVDTSGITPPAVVEPDLVADAQGRAEARGLALEDLAPLLTRQSSDTHIHLPEALAVEMRQDDELRSAVRLLAERAVTADDLLTFVMSLERPAPVVNVAAPVVNVEPPAVVVDVQAPVVNVAPQPVQLTLLKPEDGPSTKKVSLNVGGKVVSGTITES